MSNAIVLIIIIIIMSISISFIIKEKKSGKKCIGCSQSKNCTNKTCNDKIRIKK